MSYHETGCAKKPPESYFFEDGTWKKCLSYHQDFVISLHNAMLNSMRNVLNFKNCVYLKSNNKHVMQWFEYIFYIVNFDDSFRLLRNCLKMLLMLETL